MDEDDQEKGKEEEGATPRGRQSPSGKSKPHNASHLHTL